MENERDAWTVDAMEIWGGSFVKQLAGLARQADIVNLIKIKTTWQEYWHEYEMKGREMEKKEKELLRGDE